MIIGERKKTTQTEQSEEELDIPIYLRKGIRMKLHIIFNHYFIDISIILCIFHLKNTIP